MSAGRVWFYISNGGSNGPIAESDLLGLLDSGSIGRDTLVWRDGAADWIPLSSALGLSERTPPPIPGLETKPAPVLTKAEVKLSQAFEGTEFTDLSRHPWRRLLARLFDLTVHGALMLFLIGLLFIAIDQDLGKAYGEHLSKHESFAGLLAVALVMFPNALFVGFSGSTLGKWLFGIKVVDGETNAPIGVGRAFQRELRIYWSAWGLGIPIVYLFTLYNAFKDLKENGINSWDKDLNSKLLQRPNAEAQYTLNIVAVIVWVVVYAIIFSIGNE